MTGSNPVDRSKLGTKRHILTDKNGIPLSAIITSASTHDIKAVTDVIDNAVIKRPFDHPFQTKKTRRRIASNNSIYALIEHIILN